MRPEAWLVLWVIFATSIIYWDTTRNEIGELVSHCHNAEIKEWDNKLLCTECKKYCKVGRKK